MKKEQIEDLKIKYKAYLFDDILPIITSKDFIDELDFSEALNAATTAYEKFELFAGTLLEE